MQSLLLNALVAFASFSSLASACIYKRGESATWSYTGETGPLLWHHVNITNYACANGTEQSPINIETGITRGNASLGYPYTGEFEIENNGHTIELTPKNSSSFNAKLGGEDYKLLQFHFHTPSEHRLNKEHFPLEVHFVHQNVRTGAIAVVGIFFDLTVGLSDRFLAGIDLSNVEEVSAVTDSPQTEKIYLSTINSAVERSVIYTYAGSLTTPPCSEAVTWFVLENPLAVSVAQYKKFKAIMKFNSRYSQNDLHSPPNDNLITDACRA